MDGSCLLMTFKVAKLEDDARKEHCLRVCHVLIGTSTSLLGSYESKSSGGLTVPSYRYFEYRMARLDVRPPCE